MELVHYGIMQLVHEKNLMVLKTTNTTMPEQNAYFMGKTVLPWAIFKFIWIAFIIVRPNHINA